MNKLAAPLNKIKLHYLDDTGHTHSKKISEWVVESGLIRWLEFCIMLSIVTAMMSSMLNDPAGMFVSVLLVINLWVNAAQTARNVKIKRFAQKENAVAMEKSACLNALLLFHTVTPSMTTGYALLGVGSLMAPLLIYASLSASEVGLLLFSGLLSFFVALSQLRSKLIIKKMNEGNISIELVR